MGDSGGTWMDGLVEGADVVLLGPPGKPPRLAHVDGVRVGGKGERVLYVAGHAFNRNGVCPAQALTLAEATPDARASVLRGSRMRQVREWLRGAQPETWADAELLEMLGFFSRLKAREAVDALAAQRARLGKRVAALLPLEASDDDDDGASA